MVILHSYVSLPEGTPLFGLLGSVKTCLGYRKQNQDQATCSFHPELIIYIYKQQYIYPLVI